MEQREGKADKRRRQKVSQELLDDRIGLSGDEKICC